MPKEPVTDKSLKKNELEAGQIQKMLRDRSVAKQTEFTEKGNKEQGVSAGYAAEEKRSLNTFMLKQFYKSEKSIERLADEKRQKQARNDRNDGVRELVGSTMYQFLLYDRAPKEQLVTPDERHPDSLYVRSKFFDNVVSLADFRKGPNLKKLEGFEKLVASCNMLGELDYHDNNIMVRTTIDAEGKQHFEAVKIDHGRSLVTFNHDFESMVSKTADNFNAFGYANKLKTGELSFNAANYAASLNQMVAQFSDQQIDAMVDQKIDALKKEGFDPKGITLHYTFGDDNAKQSIVSVKNFDDLSSTFKTSIKKNVENMKEVAKATEIVGKFSNVPLGFQNGGWLQAFAKSKEKDPVIFAADRNIKIEGKNALQWAYDNNYQVKITDLKNTKTVKINKTQWKKDDKTNKWKEETIKVEKTINPVKTYDVIEYLATHKKDEDVLSKSEQEFLKHAMKFDLKNSDSLSVNDLKASVKKSQAIELKLVDKTLIPLIENLTNRSVGKKISEQEVEKLFDKVLHALNKDKYLTDKDVQSIKNNEDFKKNIQTTTDLINANTPTLTIKEKICYKIGDFCKKIGLSGLSKSLMNKISPENSLKIQAIEKAITKSLDIKSFLQKSSNPENLQVKRLESVQTKLDVKKQGPAR